MVMITGKLIGRINVLLKLVLQVYMSVPESCNYI